MSVTVADCERVQTSWFQHRSEVLGVDAWEDTGLVWANGDLMFPQLIDPAALARGVERARAGGSTVVGAWLGLDVDPAPLAAAGFEKGWSPWWMTGPIDLGGLPADPRVELQDAWERAWYAAAHVDGRLAGRAASHRVDHLAGVFDMEVWPTFQRRGLGTGLMQAVCAAAADAGARHVVLNSTPTGVRLYEKCGLERIGTGITWWLHPPTVPGAPLGASHSS
ncbi:GNAT family N-acetyltransferase [Cellulomonas sp. Leaf395]|uniref:GNAT family N-acetyltransferase n=1 Tax=Cellulomonas sp. Leaf395 TaxID=1736362 RepID=UPI000A5544CA|nr:GNAT family N-acetyltransferase [Cellulomonas sp. Leaf395]